MAAKTTSSFACENCGATYLNWQGQCSTCKEWNTIVEQEILGSVTQSMRISGGTAAPKPQALQVLASEKLPRIDTGSAELNRVLGDEGMFPGSVVLLAGEPGIGKSTLLLQVAAQLSAQHKVLYISAEESAQQVAQRAARLSVGTAGLEFVSAFSLEQIANYFQQDYEIIILDSIQTISSGEIRGVPGGLAQVKYCAAELTSWAKQLGKTLWLVGHITKEGGVAGPKTLEHLVDVVLQFSGEENSPLRLLRPLKNRFGSTAELGLFEMNEKGLVDVANAAELFLGGNLEPTAGSCRALIMEGRRPLLVEVQALVVPTAFSLPKRVAEGVSLSRLQLLSAVTSKYLSSKLYNCDIYLKIANGLRVEDRGLDVAIVLAIMSSLQGQPLPADLVAFAEVGLSGRLQQVMWQKQREAEAKKLGYRKAISVGSYESLTALKKLFKA